MALANSRNWRGAAAQGDLGGQELASPGVTKRAHRLVGGLAVILSASSRAFLSSEDLVVTVRHVVSITASPREEKDKHTDDATEASSAAPDQYRR